MRKTIKLKVKIVKTIKLKMKQMPMCKKSSKNNNNFTDL